MAEDAFCRAWHLAATPLTRAAITAEWTDVMGGSPKDSRRAILLEQALLVQQTLSPNSIDLFETVRRLARFYMQTDEWAKAQFFADLALDQLSELPALPENAAEPLSILGKIAMKRGQLTKAEHLLSCAGQLANHSGDEIGSAFAIVDLGVLALNQGQFETAKQRLTQALATLPDHPSSRIQRGRAMAGLGHADFGLGDLMAARQQFHLAKAYFEKHGKTKERQYLGVLNNLGLVARNSGEWTEAEYFFKQVLTQAQKQFGPESSLAMLSLANLAMVEKERGHHHQAVAYLKRALVIEENRQGRQTIVLLNELARIAMDQHQHDEARLYLDRALDKLNPGDAGGINRVMISNSLARLASIQGDHHQTKAHLEHSLMLVETHFPESKWAEETLLYLAQTCATLEQTEEAKTYLRRTAGLLEAQIQHLSRLPQTRGNFMMKIQENHRILVGLAYDLGQPEYAFQLLERFRTIGPRQYLNRRAQETATPRQPVASDLANINQHYEQTQKLADEHPEYTEETQRQRVQLKMKKKAWLRARQTSDENGTPAPVAPDIHAIQSQLEPGDLMLSYCVLEKVTLLFLISQNSFTHKQLPVGKEALQHDLQSMQTLLSEYSNQATDANQEKSLRDHCRRLFFNLIEPARVQIESADRLLFIPDSPLSRLSWSMLYGPLEPSGSEGYLIEWKPMTTVSSASVLALLKRRPKPVTSRVAAFGDPLYQQPADENGNSLLAWWRTGHPEQDRLQRLPHSAAEVTAIGRRFGMHARLFLREQATEEACKALDGDWNLIHFACHGLLDERFPMDSALVFTKTNKENGILQAWEVMEQMRFRANLAVLSACQSGLGRDAGGEGLQGLTCAFQVAGARTVLAAHWRISDASTNLLMQRFYHHLNRVSGIDEALRQAQLDLLHDRDRGGPTWFARSGDTRHPYHWAAFQLAGPGT